MSDLVISMILFTLGPLIILIPLYSLYAQDKETKKIRQSYKDLWKDAVEDPGISKEQIAEKHPLLPTNLIEDALINAFRTFLNNGELSKAETLNENHDIDLDKTLYVYKALDKIKTDKSIDLPAKIYKISLDEDERAYEKLPCHKQMNISPLGTLEIEPSNIIDTGNIYITDQRVFFVGKKGSETVYLNHIAYLDQKDEALQFFRDEGLSEIFTFPTPQHATYASFLIEALMGSAG